MLLNSIVIGQNGVSCQDSVSCYVGFVSLQSTVNYVAPLFVCSESRFLLSDVIYYGFQILFFPFLLYEFSCFLPEYIDTVWVVALEGVLFNFGCDFLQFFNVPSEIGVSVVFLRQPAQLPGIPF